MPDEGALERADDPLGVTLRHGELGGGSGLEVAGENVEPRRLVLLAHAAQHGVDEAGPSGAEHLTRQRHARVDGGVGVDPHPEKLMGAEAQDVEDVRVDLRQLAPGAAGDDRVVTPPQSGSAIDEFGDEGGVAPVQSGGPQSLGQLEVGVGALRDRAHHVVGDPARRVHVTGSRGGGRGAAVTRRAGPEIAAVGP